MKENIVNNLLSEKNVLTYMSTSSVSTIDNNITDKKYQQQEDHQCMVGKT